MRDLVLQAVANAMKHRLVLPDVTEDTPFDTIRFDDLEREEVAMEVEDELGLRISDEAMRAWTCPADIITCVQGTQHNLATRRA